MLELFDTIPLTIQHPYYINLIGQNNSYNTITENISIGDYLSSYTPFDIVINLNYPDNRAPYHGMSGVKHKLNNEKTIYILSIGILDYKDENIISLIRNLFPKIRYLMTYLTKDLTKDLTTDLEKLATPKILFHCYAGISRSSTIAIAYLAKTLHKSVHEIYNIVKSKRNCIRPNYGFVKKLIEYDNIRIVDDMIDEIREERQTKE